MNFQHRRVVSSRTRQWRSEWNHAKKITLHEDNGKSTWCGYCGVACLFWLMVMLMFIGLGSHMKLSRTEEDASWQSRHLLNFNGNYSELTYFDDQCNIVNITDLKVGKLSWEDCSFEKATGITWLWILLYSVICILMFIALAIVCDDFFVPSLEVISRRLHLSEDVAGATFMAAGSSAPELFSSVAAVTFESDVGVGTITGSAVFNLFVIIALTAVFAKKVLTIDWRPLCRDSLFYAVSVCWLIFSVWDTYIHLWESLVMIGIYVIYVIFMFFNNTIIPESIEQNCDPIEITQQQSLMKADASKGYEVTMHAEVEQEMEVTKDPIAAEDEKESESKPMEKIKCNCLCSCCPSVRGWSPPQNSLDESQHKWRELCIWQKILIILKWTYFVMAFPFLVIYSWTIPDCSRPHNAKWFMISFISSVLWIAALSFCMVTVVARTGCLIGVDSFVMSLVVLAVGTSVPDLLSSIIVARNGSGNMAVSNAIGSNVFDIDIGLGLPFLIRIIIQLGKPLNFFTLEEQRDYCTNTMLFIPHVKFGFILLVLLGFAILVLFCSKFQLNKVVASTFLLTYALFLVYAFLQEFLCSKTGRHNC